MSSLNCTVDLGQLAEAVRGLLLCAWSQHHLGFHEAGSCRRIRSAGRALRLSLSCWTCLRVYRCRSDCALLGSPLCQQRTQAEQPFWIAAKLCLPALPSFKAHSTPSGLPTLPASATSTGLSSLPAPATSPGLPLILAPATSAGLQPSPTLANSAELSPLPPTDTFA